MSVMTVEDLQATINTTKDVKWFIDYFEITIEDLTDRFPDLIVEHQEELPKDLDMEEEEYPYDDRSDD